MTETAKDWLKIQPSGAIQLSGSASYLSGAGFEEVHQLGLEG
ncbi:hypothetical protein J2S98_002777 [Arthrobacter oryzae]|nr:hypothetical protein [Arthrobacter oryzae]